MKARTMDKILSFENIEGDIKKIKKRGVLVLVGGCFDILHTGHIEFLKAAKKQGDILLIMLESDESVRAKKGKNRPANGQKPRADILASLPAVDYILPLPYLKSDLDYYNLVKTIEPDIIAVTATDTALHKKSEQAEIVGGKIVEVIKRLPYSTTDLINK